MAAATLNWTPAEIDEVLDAVTASSIVRGRKKALEELNRARPWDFYPHAAHDSGPTWRPEKQASEVAGSNPSLD